MKPAKAPTTLDREQLRRAVEAALPEALGRAQLLGEIRGALEKGDDAAAILLMRRYCGLPTLKAS